MLLKIENFEPILQVKQKIKMWKKIILLIFFKQKNCPVVDQSENLIPIRALKDQAALTVVSTWEGHTSQLVSEVTENVTAWDPR